MEHAELESTTALTARATHIAQTIRQENLHLRQSSTSRLAEIEALRAELDNLELGTGAESTLAPVGGAGTASSTIITARSDVEVGQNYSARLKRRLAARRKSGKSASAAAAATIGGGAQASWGGVSESTATAMADAEAAMVQRRPHSATLPTLPPSEDMAWEEEGTAWGVDEEVDDQGGDGGDAFSSRGAGGGLHRRGSSGSRLLGGACDNCGALAETGSSFCTQCGVRL